MTFIEINVDVKKQLVTLVDFGIPRHDLCILGTQGRNLRSN